MQIAYPGQISLINSNIYVEKVPGMVNSEESLPI